MLHKINLLLSLTLLTAFSEEVSGQSNTPYPNACFTDVEKLLEQGKCNAALERAKEVRFINACLQDDPNEQLGLSYYWIAKSYLSLSDIRMTRVYLDSASAAIDGHKGVLYHQVESMKAMLSKEPRPIQEAITYFAPLNNKLTAEAWLALGTCHLLSGERQTVATELHTCLSILKESNLQNSVNAARCRALLGYYFWKIEKKFELATEYFDASEAIYLRLGGPQSSYLGALYINSGGCWDDRGHVRKAIDYYLKAEANLLGLDRQHPNLISLYNNLGNSYADLGEYSLSSRYLKKAIELVPDSKNHVKGRYWNNLGDAYMKCNEDSLAEQCFYKALTLFKDSDDYNTAETARPLHNLGIILRNRGQIDESLDYELKSIPFRKMDPAGYLDLARSFHGAAECYLIRREFSLALSYVDSALALQGLVAPSGIHGEIATTLMTKAECLHLMGNSQVALESINKAVFACNYRPESGLVSVIAPSELLDALGARAELHYRSYLASKDKNVLIRAEKDLLLAAKAIHYFRSTLIERESRAVFAGKFRKLLSKGVVVSDLLSNLIPDDHTHFKNAFAFAEQSKSLVLLEGIRNSGAHGFQGVPANILDHERSLKESVTIAEIILRNLLNSGVGVQETEILQAKDELFAKQKEYEDYKRWLASSNFRDYYNIRFGVDLATPEEIQSELLAPEQSFISYFTTEDDQIIAFLVNRDTAFALNLDCGTEWMDWVQDFRSGILGYYTLEPGRRSENLYQETIFQYIGSARKLYDSFVFPFRTFIRKDVVVVTDGALGYLPFELLLTGPVLNPANFSSYPYWFRTDSLNISYTFSGTLLREMKEKEHISSPRRELIALAPFYDRAQMVSQRASSIEGSTDDSELGDLSNSGPEVKSICSIIEGDYWLGTTATKEKFIQEVSDYRIVHVSTHGVLDDYAEYSYLAFRSEEQGKIFPLYIRELYNLQLNSDLVTLSACETGLGPIRPGEGIISLSRAFVYAGTKSIVTSLWQVDDAATGFVMRSFYKQLAAGKNKDRALSEAKIDYLMNHPGSQSHPFFWAAFIGVGDMESLIEK